MAVAEVVAVTQGDYMNSKYWYPLAAPSLGDEEVEAATAVLRSRRTTMGEHVERFEEKFAQFVRSRHAVMVNSGSSADLLMAMLLTSPRVGRLEQGDEVLISAVTWPTHVWSYIMAGFKVQLIDVDSETLNVSRQSEYLNISGRVRLYSAVHLLGNPAPIDIGLPVQEDCCEALGARSADRHVGAGAHAASFSLFFSHHMTTMEGGVVITDDDEAADELRMMRSHGWLRGARHVEVPTGIDPRYAFPTWGLNVRPTELQGAIGSVQLGKLPEWLEARHALAQTFRRYTLDTGWLRSPVVAEGVEPSWMALPVMVQRGAPYTRGELADYLERHGVETRPIVAGNLARQPAAELLHRRGALSWGMLPEADVVHERGLYVGLYPGADVGRLVGVLEDFRDGEGP